MELRLKSQKIEIMEDIDLLKYIYWEFSLAVLIMTDMVKMFLKNVQLKFIQFIIVKNPKWITLIVAIFLSVLDWLVIGSANKFHLFQYIISLGVTILGYDYIWKLVKEQYSRFRNPETKTDG